MLDLILKHVDAVLALLHAAIVHELLVNAFKNGSAQLVLKDGGASCTPSKARCMLASFAS